MGWSVVLVPLTVLAVPLGLARPEVRILTEAERPDAAPQAGGADAGATLAPGSASGG